MAKRNNCNNCTLASRPAVARKPGLETFPALHAQDGEATVLERLGQAEEDDPEHTLGTGADGQGHLGKREDITRDAQGEHDHAGGERQPREPPFHGSQHALDSPRGSNVGLLVVMIHDHKRQKRPGQS